MLVFRWLVRLLRYGRHDSRQGPKTPLAYGVPAARLPVFEAMLEASCAMVLYFQIINKGGLFLTRDEAMKAENAITVFCTCYTYLAHAMHQAGMARFHLEPSLHLFQHKALRIRMLLDKGAARVWSPASFLCESGEDYIGRVARVSRRVSARLTSQRTLQRVLIKTYFDWKDLESQ